MKWQKIGFSHQIWRFVVPLFSFLIITGCGLPDYAKINPPTTVGLDPNLKWVGFKTPTDDTNITGYVVYYKIYTNLENSLYDDDRNAFTSSSEELPLGDTLPVQQEFVRAGGTDLGRVFPSSTGFNIPHINPGENVYINFDPTNEPNSNDRAEPEVVRVDPDPGVGTPLGITLTRGYIDIEDPSASPPLRYFVNDWRVEADTSSGYFDGDLRRPPPKPQPGSAEDEWTGTPIFTSGNLPTSLQIAIVVYSVGLDSTGGGLTFLESEPVHLGRVEYTNILAKVR